MAREAFAQWLQEELTPRGWDQSELRRRAHLATGVIPRLLAMEHEASPQTLRALARALQIPAEEVFRRAGLLPKPSSVEQPEGGDELLRYYTSVSDDDRRVMLRVMRARSIYLGQSGDLGGVPPQFRNQFPTLYYHAWGPFSRSFTITYCPCSLTM